MYSQTHVLLNLFIDKSTSTRQRRRLVINIGGAKIWVTNIGGGVQKFWENIFSDQHSKTTF